MHALPPIGHKAREMFAIEDLVAIGVGERQPVVGRPQARAMARRFFAGAHPAACRLVMFFMPADGSLQLVSIGRRGGFKVEWQFSKGVQV